MGSLVRQPVTSGQLMYQTHPFHLCTSLWRIYKQTIKCHIYCQARAYQYCLSMLVPQEHWNFIPPAHEDCLLYTSFGPTPSTPPPCPAPLSPKWIQQKVLVVTDKSRRLSGTRRRSQKGFSWLDLSLLWQMELQKVGRGLLVWRTDIVLPDPDKCPKSIAPSSMLRPNLLAICMHAMLY